MNSDSKSIIWLISGPTSVGKSTFINSERCSEITNCPKDTPTIMAHSFQSSVISDLPVYLHYNILRSSEVKSGLFDLFFRDEKKITEFEFQDDSIWTEILHANKIIKAIVLVSSEETILRRLEERQVVEYEHRVKGKSRKYPKRKWKRIVSYVDMLSLYKQWCQELKLRGIPYILLNSQDRSYPEISREDNIESILNMEKTKYSKAQIKLILKKKVFEYQRIELPYGLTTKGSDRRKTRDLIFPRSLKGKSILDIGCALGYMCFEAETLGAERVVGVEIKENRFKGATILKDIKESNVVFLQRDILNEPIEEQFDYVLLLNVIHHLKEPINVLRKLATLTREKLIIEFPTLEDKKFNKTINELPYSMENLPIIGVSSLRHADQTFLFTPQAIVRILKDHDSLFKRIETMKLRK